MRGVLYAVILASLFYVPLRRVNVADILPVEAIAVYIEGNKVVLEADTGDRGKGNSIQEALRNLEKESASIVYLDTARHLIVAPGAEQYVEQLRPMMRSSAQVCIGDAKGHVEQTANYLSAHKKLPSLRNWHSEKIN